MPKELFNPNQYNEYSRYLKKDLKLIKTIESTSAHHTFAYWIPPTNTNQLMVCDNCSARATFLVFDQDHIGQTSVNLSCGAHASPAFQGWLNEAR
jgi:hypothetical protein